MFDVGPARCLRCSAVVGWGEDLVNFQSHMPVVAILGGHPILCVGSACASSRPNDVCAGQFQPCHLLRILHCCLSYASDPRVACLASVRIKYCVQSMPQL